MHFTTATAADSALFLIYFDSISIIRSGPVTCPGNIVCLADCPKGIRPAALLNLLKLRRFAVLLCFLFFSLFFIPQSRLHCSIYTLTTMFNFSWFKSSSNEDANTSTWNPNTLTMDQPSSPAAPAVQQQQQVVAEQPVSSLPVVLYIYIYI